MYDVINFAAWVGWFIATVMGFIVWHQHQQIRELEKEIQMLRDSQRLDHAKVEALRDATIKAFNAMAAMAGSERSANEVKRKLDEIFIKSMNDDEL